jgi:DTW domain-containing protein YfiP
MSLEDRCPRCVLSPARCVCAELPSLRTRTRIVVVRHGRELRKPSGTARIAALALPDLELIDYRDEPGEMPPRWLAEERELVRAVPVWPPERVGARLAALEDACLLFPTGRPLETISAPRTIVLLDGTWRQARAMYQRIPGAAALPAARLSGLAAATERLRRPVREGERSTLEALADALAVLEGEAVAAPLRALHARFVGAAVQARWGPTGRPR